MGETGYWYKRWLEMGLSRMKGNFHVRFLGGERAAMPLATLYISYMQASAAVPADDFQFSF